MNRTSFIEILNLKTCLLEKTVSIASFQLVTILLLGYLLVCDFGISKRVNSDVGEVTYTKTGTYEYMAPEILKAKKKKGEGYGRMVDWWALGTLMYELLIGIPPFYHNNSHKMQKMIKKKDFQYPDLESMGLVVSDKAKDLINQLLKKDPDERLGFNGDVEAILSHPWFADIDREQLMQR